MLNILIENSFQRDLKRCKKRGYKLSKIHEAITLLVNNQNLPKRFHNHRLSGNYEGYWECHIEPDWLLIYHIDTENNNLHLAYTGTHADLY
jgi:mRNA interferase YafQ